MKEMYKIKLTTFDSMSQIT